MLTRIITNVKRYLCWWVVGEASKWPMYTEPWMGSFSKNTFFYWMYFNQRKFMICVKDSKICIFFLKFWQNSCIFLVNSFNFYLDFDCNDFECTKQNVKPYHTARLVKELAAGRRKQRHDFCSYRVIQRWNLLPVDIKLAPSLDSFKARLDILIMKD